MDILRRSMAPVSDAAWKEIDEEARRVLAGNLTCRRLVDFDGPRGWDLSSVNLGQLQEVTKKPVKGVDWGMRVVQPLAEVRVPFQVDKWEMDNVDRGCETPDLDAVADAARKTALFEEMAVCHGLDEACIRGMCQDSPHKPVSVPADVSDFLPALEGAVVNLQKAGVGGPYALLLDSDMYQLVMAGDNRGYPLHKRVTELAEGGLHWGPAVKGGILLSQRGGDFKLTVGVDVSVGYKGDSTKKVDLYLTESFTFQVLEPAAAVALQAKSK